MGVDLYLASTLCDSESGYDDVTAYVTDFSPNANGIWDMVGHPWNYLTGVENPDGSITYDVGVLVIPTGETTTAAGAITGSYTGSNFNVSLTPAGFDFDGYNVSESFPNNAMDGCYNLYPNTATPLGNPAAYYATVSGSSYSDSVAAPTGWVTHYQGLLVINSGQSCGWSTAQYVAYNGTQYVQNSLAVNITPSNACASRAGVSGGGC